MSQGQVAREAGVSRSIVAQLEEGRVATPNEKVVNVLAAHTQTPSARIREEVAEWREHTRPQLSQRAKNVTALPPEVVARYESFEQWRNDIAENITQFSSLLGVSRNTLLAYERGDTRTMPKPLIRALYNRLDLSDAYVAAVTRLPRESVPEEDQ